MSGFVTLVERQSMKVLLVQCSLLPLYDHRSSPLGLKKKATCPKSLTSGSLILSIVFTQTEKCEREALGWM